MANWSILYIGEVEAQRWRNDVPETNDPALCFLFRPSDKRVDKIRNRPGFESKDADAEYANEKDCWYQTTVGEARARFDRLGLTVANLDRWIASSAGIPVESVELGVMDPDSYPDGIAVAGPLDKNELELKYSRLFEDPESDDYWNAADRINRAEVGILPALRNLRRILDTTASDAIVWLDLWDISPEEFDSFTLITFDYDGKVHLDRNYLDVCKAHYSASEFDLVYIELIVALESEIQSYLRRLFEKKGVPDNRATPYVERMIAELPFVSLIRFIFLVLEDRTARMDLIDEVERAYNVRNNVVHRNMRTFDVPAVTRAMSAIEETIELVRGFSPHSEATP